MNGTDNPKGPFVLTWANAPESARQALMNGERMAAVSPGKISPYLRTSVNALRRYVARGSGKGKKSIVGHEWYTLKKEHTNAYKRAWAKRQARECGRGIHVFHQEVLDDRTVELCLITNLAALGTVGTALQNCLRHAYTGRDGAPYAGQDWSKFWKFAYVGIRHQTEGGSPKWTSLARVVRTELEIKTDRRLVSDCHEAFQNDDDAMPNVDKYLWEQCLSGDLLTSFRNAWLEYRTGPRTLKSPVRDILWGARNSGLRFLYGDVHRDSLRSYIELTRHDWMRIQAELRQGMEIWTSRQLTGTTSGVGDLQQLPRRSFTEQNARPENVLAHRELQRRMASAPAASSLLSKLTTRSEIQQQPQQQ